MQHITINKQIEKEITFFCEDLIEEQLIFPVMEKFRKNNYKTNISRNLDEKAEIGYYCCPSNHIKSVNSKLSIISLGGMDQGKLFWPNFWLKESWKKFDIGILPGIHWSNMWKLSSWFINSNPKLCISVTGWPKTQAVSNLKLYSKDETRFNILYAPSFENDKKGHSVVNAVKKMNINLHIKHLPWRNKEEKIRFRDIRYNISKMIKFAKKEISNLKIHDSKDNIMKILNSVDLLITDESSLIYESLIFNIPVLSCKDWKMRSSNTNKARYIKQDKDVCIYINQENLEEKIREIIKNYKKFQIDLRNKKDNHFSNIETSIDEIFNLINQAVTEKKIINFENPAYKVNYLKSFVIVILNKLKSFVN